jgi:hypothetical protein
MVFSEVVKIVDVRPFTIGAGDAFRFRLEISRVLNTTFHFGKVYRLETYRLQPTFPQVDGALPVIKNDALIYIVDDVFDQDELRGESIEDVIASFEKVFHRIFGKMDQKLD